MTKAIFLLISIFVFLSCKNDHENKCSNFLIKNDVLIKEIKMFYHNIKFNTTSQFIITVDYSSRGDTNIYSISYDRNLYPLMKYPPDIFILIDDFHIGFNSKMTDFFKIETNNLHQILENAFPRQYDYYIKTGGCPPPTTGMTERWKIFFCDTTFTTKLIDEY